MIFLSHLLFMSHFGASVVRTYVRPLIAYNKDTDLEYNFTHEKY